MKKLLILAVTGAFALYLGTPTVHAQSSRKIVRGQSSNGFENRAPSQPPPAPAPSGPSVSGSVPQAIRSGNPLQMLNPFAPASYGNGAQNVRRESNDPDQRPRGFKLLAFEF